MSHPARLLVGCLATLLLVVLADMQFAIIERVVPHQPVLTFLLRAVVIIAAAGIPTALVWWPLHHRAARRRELDAQLLEIEAEMAVPWRLVEHGALGEDPAFLVRRDDTGEERWLVEIDTTETPRFDVGDGLVILTHPGGGLDVLDRHLFETAESAEDEAALEASARIVRELGEDEHVEVETAAAPEWPTA